MRVASLLCGCALLVSAPVYLICLILVSVCVCLSVCLSLFPPLCWFSSPCPWFGPGLSCPVLSSPPGSPLPSRRLVSFGLVFFPLQTTSPPLPHLLSPSPLKTRTRGRVQHSAAPHTIHPAGSASPYRVLTLCPPPLSASTRRAATFPESIPVPEASFWRQQRYVSIRTGLFRSSLQPIQALHRVLPGFASSSSPPETPRATQPAFVASDPPPQALIEEPPRS